MRGSVPYNPEVHGDFNAILRPPEPLSEQAEVKPPAQLRGSTPYDAKVHGEVFDLDSPVQVIDDMADSEPKYDFSEQVSNSYLNALAQVESSGKVDAKAPTSSATGLYQFIDSTWIDMFKKHKPDQASSMDPKSILALRNDPKVATELVSRFTEGNQQYLISKGVEPTNGNLYLAHFLGMGRAAQVLTARPSTPIDQIVSSRAIRANPGVFKNVKTAGDLANWAERKMERASENYNFDVASLMDVAMKQSDSQVAENEKQADKPVEQPESTPVEDGKFYMSEEGVIVRSEGGRLYRADTGEVLFEQPTRGEDVGSIEATDGLTPDLIASRVGEFLGLERSTQQRLAELFGAPKAAVEMAEEITGASLLENTQAALKKEDYLGAAAEVALEVLPPGLEELARSMMVGIRSLKAGKEFGTAVDGITPREAFEAAEVAAEGDKKVLDDLRKKTGWHRDTDGNLQFEIDDSVMEIVPDLKPQYRPQKELVAKDASGNYTNVKLTVDQVVDHPQLFEQYPNLKNVKFGVMEAERGIAGFATRDGKLIAVSRNLWENDPEEVKKTIVHELQHVIQRYEGWTAGNNVQGIQAQMFKELSKNNINGRQMLSDALDEGKKVFAKAVPSSSWATDFSRQSAPVMAATIALLKGGKAGERYFKKQLVDRGLAAQMKLDWARLEAGEGPYSPVNANVMRIKNSMSEEELAKFIKDYEKAIDPYLKFELESRERYYKTLGEANARNTEARMNMSEETRKNIHPNTTRDIPEGQMLDRDGNLIIKAKNETN